MNRLRLFVSLALCAAGIASSAQTAAGETGRPSGQALQFEIGSWFSLSSFGGTTLSYQRFVSPDVAWRASVGIGISYSRVERYAEYATSFEASDSVEFARQSHSVSVASEWLWYRGERVSMFFGGGPRVSYSSHKDGDSYYYGPGDSWRHYRSSNNALGAGLQGCIGVQWAASNWLALHAQYGSECEYMYRVRESSAAQTGTSEFFDRYTDTSNGVRFSSGVRFGLSAYF